MMGRQAKVRFVRCYSQILTRAWCDEGFCAALETDPLRLIAECGWILPEGACVSVLRLPSQDPDIDSQLELWEVGEMTGSYILTIPILAMKGLTDHQLDGVVGGSRSGAELYERLSRKLIAQALSTGSIF